MHLIGISMLSGSHKELVPDVLAALKEREVHAPVVVGGIIPDNDADALRSLGIARVYTPKDFDMARIMDELATLVAETAEGSGRG